MPYTAFANGLFNLVAVKSKMPATKGITPVNVNGPKIKRGNNIAGNRPPPHNNSSTQWICGT